VLPCFDVVITGISEQLKAKATNPTLTGNSSSHGTLSSELEDRALRHWVKAFKIRSIASAPWAITIFLDVDTQPCMPTFAGLLMRALGRADVAFSQHSSARFGDKTVRHNSACMVMNMTSPRTRKLLRQWELAYFAVRTPLPTTDQPALSQALQAMLKPEPPLLNHVDISPQLCCRFLARVEASDCSKDVPRPCALVHKPNQTSSWQCGQASACASLWGEGRPITPRTF